MQGAGCRVQGAVCRVQGAGFRGNPVPELEVAEEADDSVRVLVRVQGVLKNTLHKFAVVPRRARV